MSLLASGSRPLFLATVLLFAGLAASAPGVAQTGTITGIVTSAQNGQPLPAAQVYIPALDIGVLTQANGRFTLQNVPAGVHQLTAERIGHRVTSASVTVAAGAAAVQNFVMNEEALQLDEVVVTGTAGGSQRRAVGNLVAAVDVSQLASAAPIATVEDALLGRTPGVHLMPATNAGGGSKIRIRGHASMALAGDPIIYVDGVRLNDNRSNVGRHENMSRLADFDPNTIESIEIIKGPAAATLYGTEASNGVIQIVTKRGQAGAPVFEFSAELGQNYWPMWSGYNRYAWTPNPNAGCTVATLPCTSEDQLIGYRYADANRELGFMYPWQNGLVQRYSGAVRGGTDSFRYSFALNRADEEGIVFWNTDERNSITANIGVTASEQLSLQLSGGYYQGTHHPAEGFWASNYGWGGVPMGYFNTDGSRATCGDGSEGKTYADINGVQQPCPGPQDRGWADGGPEQFLPKRFEHLIALKRSTWSLQANLNVTDWLSHRLTLGVDNVYEREENLRIKEGTDFWHGTDGLEGDKSVSTLDAPVYTVDLSGTATFRLMEERLGTATSYGVQYYSKESRRSGATGENFLVGALTTVSAGSLRQGTESFVENTTLGLYVQQQLDWENRIFLTGAVRGDDNSAFGTNYEAAIYPKLSATWVLHEEDFWNIDWMDQLRLRAAWGTAGKQPDAFAATRLYSTQTGPNQQPIVTPSQFGNPDLGPETGQELEVGFDASFFEGRIGTTFTYYNRTTKDAIIGRTIPPSLWPGDAGAFAGGLQYVNIGEIRGWGTETTLTAQVIPEGPVRLDMDLSFTTQGNEITDMAGIPRIQEGRARAHIEGFSIASASDLRVVSATFLSGDRGSVTGTEMCDSGAGKNGLEFGGPPVPCAEAPQLVWGPTDPTRILNVNPTLTVFDNWRLSANVEAQWGHWMSSDYATARYTSYVSSKLVWLQDDPVGMAYINITRNGLGYHKAGFAKLRELSLSYTVPSGLASRIGATAANIRVGVRNAHRFWLQQKDAGDPTANNGAGLKYPEPAADPEMGRSEYIFSGESGGGWPPIPQWTIRLGVTF
jgi:TonB-linked SusC/RagA family outer membrane protein